MATVCCKKESRGWLLGGQLSVSAKSPFEKSLHKTGKNQAQCFQAPWRKNRDDSLSQTSPALLHKTNTEMHHQRTSIMNHCHIFLFWLCCGACRILVPRPGIEPVPPAVEVWGPNHWTTGNFPPVTFWKGKEVHTLASDVPTFSSRCM